MSMDLYFVDLLSLVLSKKEISISVLSELIMAGYSAVFDSMFFTLYFHVNISLSSTKLSTSYTCNHY